MVELLSKAVVSSLMQVRPLRSPLEQGCRGRRDFGMSPEAHDAAEAAGANYHEHGQDQDAPVQPRSAAESFRKLVVPPGLIGACIRSGRR